MKTISALVVGLLLCAGCTTVTQHPVASQAPSWDGNQQTSGILAKTVDGYIVTDNFRARYNDLVAIYGAAKTLSGSPIFTPALTADFGITPVPSEIAISTYKQSPLWLISKQAMGDMVVMSDMKRRGFKP